MGACASKPKDLDNNEAPAPVEAPASPKAEAASAPQENNGEVTEAKKEEPLVDLSEPEAPKVEEVAAVEEAKPAVEAAKPAEEEKKVEAVVEEVKNVETPKVEEVKNVETPKVEEKSDAPAEPKA